MADNIRMDSHKLIYHPERVADWLKGDNIYPICAEISPSGICNHRCVFCGLDYLGYQSNFLDKDVILPNIKIMAEHGLKSLVVCGEGEPFLNTDTPEIINVSKSFGVDMGVSTNGVYYIREVAENTLKNITWIRFSLNAGSNETHQFLHKGKNNDFDLVIQNIMHACEIKKQSNYSATIGVQLILLPENKDEVVNLAKILKEINVDYFAIKPYSKHPESSCELYNDIDYREYLYLEEELKAISSEKFNIIFRSASMLRKKEKKGYDQCFGLPFWVYINSDAEVWACIAYIGNPKFSYGSLKELTFEELWKGDKKKELDAYIKTLDIGNCRELCRLDAINSYLYELKHPSEHVNFI